LEPDSQLAKASRAETKLLKDLVTRHLSLTGSPRALWILDNWSEALPRFIKVFPHEHKRVLGFPRRQQPYIPGQVSTGTQSSATSLDVAQREPVQHG
jgi:hypothetical protein